MPAIKENWSGWLIDERRTNGLADREVRFTYSNGCDLQKEQILIFCIDKALTDEAVRTLNVDEQIWVDLE